MSDPEIIITHQGSTPKAWEYEEKYTPSFLPALILFPPIAPVFWKYHICVNEKALSLGYSYYFRKEIDRSQIQKAEAIEHINGFTEWGGWGYRKNLTGQSGYITKNGPGIRLVYKEKHHEKEDVIVFNCDSAKEVCQMLNTDVANAFIH